MANEEEQEIIFWIRVIKGKRISFTREHGIAQMGLAGPITTKVFKRCKELIALLEHRNDWAYWVNVLNPDLQGGITKPDTHHRFVFEKYGREFVLTFNPKQGRWALGLLNQQPPAAGAAPNASPPNIGGGGGANSVGSANSVGGGAGGVLPLPRAPAPEPQAGDEYRLISEAPRGAGRKRASRLARLWRAYKAVQQSPRFRHMSTLLALTMAQAKEALRHFAGQAQKALLFALGWDDDAGNHSVTRLVHLVQESRFGAVFEPQVVERAGRTLTVWTFSEYAKPNWELWLFGRLIEDEHLAV